MWQKKGYKKFDSNKGPRCFGCREWGRIQDACPNILSKINIIYTPTTNRRLYATGTVEGKNSTIQETQELTSQWYHKIQYTFLKTMRTIL